MKEKLNNENNSLEKKLENLFSNSNLEDEKTDLPKIDAASYFNTLEQRFNKQKQKAKVLISEMLNFYLTNDFISQNTYLEQKKQLDVASLSGIMQQIDLNEIASKHIMLEITQGVPTPRLFEVFSALQKTYIELTKMKTMFVINAEESIKKLKGDYDFYNSENYNEYEDVGEKTKQIDPAKNNEVIYRGTEKLLNEIDEDDPDDFEFEAPHT